jgi:Protein of unknown function (DUF2971)
MSNTLYHYCSNTAFQSIMTTRKLRLSLLTMSNDSNEGQHAVEVAQRLLPPDFEHRNSAIEQFKFIMAGILAIGFCLSADGDILSQWRGYADDARGVAIGFDSEALEQATAEFSRNQLITRLAPVAYGQEFLEMMIKEDLAPIIEHYNSGKMTPPGGLLFALRSEIEQSTEQEAFKKANSESFWMLMRLANYAYMVKSPFFAEEKERRLLSLVTVLNKKLTLHDAGFVAGADSLKPFREFPAERFDPKLITKIIVGPRHQTPAHVMRLFLDSNGFEHVEIARSTGSYR